MNNYDKMHYRRKF